MAKDTLQDYGRDTLWDYVRSLPDEDVRFLNSRLGQKLAGDTAEAVGLMERSPDMLRFLDVNSRQEYFGRIDAVESAVAAEARRRQAEYRNSHRR